MFGYTFTLPSPAGLKDAKFPQRGNFAPFFRSLVFLAGRPEESIVFWSGHGSPLYPYICESDKKQ